MNIYDNIQRLAKEKKMTISEIATKTSLSRDGIASWNEHSPSVKNLQHIW